MTHRRSKLPRGRVVGSRSIAAALAGGLCVSMVSPPVQAVAPRAAVARASVQVDAAALGEPAEVLGPMIQARAEAALHEAEVLAAEDRDDPVIDLEIAPLPDDAGYRTTYAARQDGEPVAGISGTNECRLCTDEELLAQVERTMTSIAGKLRAEATPEPAVDADGPPAPRPSPTSTPVDEPRRRTRLGDAGLGLTVVGAATTGLGIGLAISEPLLLHDDSRRQRALIQPGIVVAAVGVAVLGTGIAMMIVDARRSRKNLSLTPGAVRVRF